jgi:hypothetical protein
MTDSSASDNPAGIPPLKAPPATFEFLVQTLFTQALMAFGRVPNPITQQSLKNLDTARHFIDTLEMLGKKTAGNLEQDEQRLLDEVLHQLRMTYMQEQSASGPDGPTLPVEGLESEA